MPFTESWQVISSEWRRNSTRRGGSHMSPRYALVYGKSSKFCPQPQKVRRDNWPSTLLTWPQVGLTHLVHDEDVVTVFAK